MNLDDLPSALKQYPDTLCGHKAYATDMLEICTTGSMGNGARFTDKANKIYSECPNENAVVLMMPDSRYCSMRDAAHSLAWAEEDPRTRFRTDASTLRHDWKPQTGKRDKQIAIEINDEIFVTNLIHVPPHFVNKTEFARPAFFCNTTRCLTQRINDHHYDVSMKNDRKHNVDMVPHLRLQPNKSKFDIVGVLFQVIGRPPPGEIASTSYGAGYWEESEEDPRLAGNAAEETEREAAEAAAAEAARKLEEVKATAEAAAAEAARELEEVKATAEAAAAEAARKLEEAKATAESEAAEAARKLEEMEHKLKQTERTANAAAAKRAAAERAAKAKFKVGDHWQFMKGWGGSTTTWEIRDERDKEVDMRKLSGPGPSNMTSKKSDMTKGWQRLQSSH